MVRPNLSQTARRAKQNLDYGVYSNRGTRIVKGANTGGVVVKKGQGRGNPIKDRQIRRKTGPGVDRMDDTSVVIEVETAVNHDKLCNSSGANQTKKVKGNLGQVGRSKGEDNNSRSELASQNCELAFALDKPHKDRNNPDLFKRAFDNISGQCIPDQARDMALEAKKKELREQISKLRKQEEEEEDEEYRQLLKEKKELERRLSRSTPAENDRKKKSKSKQDTKLSSQQLAINNLIDMQGVAGLKIDRELLDCMSGKNKPKSSHTENNAFEQLNNMFLGKKSKAKGGKRKRKQGRRKSRRDSSSSESTSTSESSSESSDESDGESESEGSADERKCRKRKGKFKSGFYEKVGSAKLISKEVYAHAALEEDTGGSTKFTDLSFNLLVAGELEIVLHKKTSKKERQTRLQLLRVLAYKHQNLSLEEILDQYASFIRKVERGKYQWGNENQIEKFEQQLVYRISVEAKSRAEKARKGDKSEKRPGRERKKLYCSEFNKGKCTQDSPHETKMNGNVVMVYHVCKKCLLDEGLEKYHVDCSSKK